MSVVAETGGSKIVFADVAKQDISVSETPTEINYLIETPSTEPLRYKALLSQNAPIATTTDPTMVAGQIWTLEAYNVADAATIAALEKISGTLYAVGSKYRSATNQTLNVNVATTLSYDGSPYIVSTDVNGDFNPFVNTLGNIVWSYSSAGTFLGTLTSAFTDKKVFPTLNNFRTNGSAVILRIGDNQIRIVSFDNTYTEADDIILRSSVEIEVYP